MTDFCEEIKAFRLTHLGQRETVVDSRAEVIEILRHFPEPLHVQVRIEWDGGVTLRGDEAWRLWRRCRGGSSSPDGGG